MKSLAFWENPTFAAKSRQEKFLAVFPWVWLIAAYCGTIAFLWFKCRGYIDSDMSAEMILADLLNREGDVLLSKNWWYSTEIRVFYLQIFQRLGLLLFPQDWYAARVFSQALWLAVLVAAYLYVGHGLHLRGNGAWGAAALMCPFSAWYFLLVTLGGYYIPHMILVLLGLGLTLHLLQPGTRPLRRAVQAAALLAVCLFSGLNGLKGLMAFFIPQLAAAAVLLWMHWQQTPTQCPRREKFYFGAAFLSLGAAGAGYLLNSKVLATQYHFQDFSETTWTRLDPAKLLRSWGDLLSLFGYAYAPTWENNTAVLSKEGVLSCGGLVIAGAFVFFLARLLLRLPQLPREQQVLPVLTAAICLIQGFLFAYTHNVYAEEIPYLWLTVIPFPFLIIQMGAEHTEFRVPCSKAIAGLGYAVCVAAASVSAVIIYQKMPKWTRPSQEVYHFLVENGYTQGYASYWNSDVLTEWSSGQLEIWVVADYSTMEPFGYSQLAAHADPPEGELFLLLTKDDLGYSGLADVSALPQVVYDDGYSYVLDFESYDAMVSTLQTLVLVDEG